MKLTLDDLKVDSYATQVSETELTETKGGAWTTPVCADIVIAVVGAVVTIATAVIGDEDHEHTHCDVTTTTTYDECGNVTGTSTDYGCNDGQ